MTPGGAGAVPHDGHDGPALAVRGITKTYPGVTALDDVGLVIGRGTVHALVGENGAGKSTLVKVITGAVAPDRGEIEVGGAVVGALTPVGAAKLGISVIPQERQIAFDLSITENVLLGRLPRSRLGGVDWRVARRATRDLLARIGLELDVRTPVRDLSVAQLQLLEVARALSAEARVVLMDEPTSALSAVEVEILFASIRRLQGAGRAVVYISHHLEEIFEIADEVTVLRDGRVVETRPVAGLDAHRLTALMIGREPEELEERIRPDQEPVAGAVSRVECRDLHRPPGLRGVSLRVAAGEVLCVTGAVGSGRRELARCLAGIERPASGEVVGDGRPLGGPRDAIRRGIVFVPEDRKREGLLLELTVLDNLALGSMTCARSPFLRPWRLRREAGLLVDKLGVKTPSVGTPVRLLSGGNQQKVVLGRWLGVGARTFVFDEPTAGIDVGAKVEIYRLLRELADEGAAIVLFSSDFEEIKIMADRVIVLRRGRVAGELARDDVTEERLLALQLEAA